MKANIIVLYSVCGIIMAITLINAGTVWKWLKAADKWVTDENPLTAIWLFLVLVLVCWGTFLIGGGSV